MYQMWKDRIWWLTVSDLFTVFVVVHAGQRAVRVSVDVRVHSTGVTITCPANVTLQQNIIHSTISHVYLRCFTVCPTYSMAPSVQTPGPDKDNVKNGLKPQEEQQRMIREDVQVPLTALSFTTSPPLLSTTKEEIPENFWNWILVDEGTIFPMWLWTYLSIRSTF